jgi:hypothetical protein
VTSDVLATVEMKKPLPSKEEEAGVVEGCGEEGLCASREGAGEEGDSKGCGEWREKGCEQRREVGFGSLRGEGSA